MVTKNERLRVLVVDDDPACRDYAREALSGHDRYFAGTAREGLDLFRAQQPDMTFLDLSLPDDNGLETLLEIRESRPEAFVVILTASRLTDDVMLAQRCGANGYITKPFSRKMLQQYSENYAKHQQKMAALDEATREKFHGKVRMEMERMRLMLHTPTPEAKAALLELLPRWNILIGGSGESQGVAWQAALSQAGCKVTRVSSGDAALKVAGEQSFRLVLLEETLEDMDAAELLYRLRVNQQIVPALVVVDAEWKQRQQKWRKVGANRILLGPLSAERIRTMVEKEIARSLHEADDVFLQT